MQAKLRTVTGLDLVELKQTPDGKASARELAKYDDKVVYRIDLLLPFPRL